MPSTAANEAINWTEHLKEVVLNRTAKVCVIGLGYVGLPLAVEKAKVGFTVLGIDRNSNRVNQLNRGVNYIKDVNGTELAQLVEDNRLCATDVFDM